ncbi:hypothetical protein [Nannocystis pusilla]|uniref:hypothetical protein n=1 Tax=Nannocystis pusilla TaxID=889268 RepID=UPI003BF2B16C
MIYPICGAEFENTDGHSRIVTGALERWYRIGDAIRWDTKTEQERSQVAPLSPIYTFDLDDDCSVRPLQDVVRRTGGDRSGESHHERLPADP